MQRHIRRRIAVFNRLLGAALAILLTCGGNALAQPATPTAADKELAHRLMDEADAAYDAGRAEQAKSQNKAPNAKLAEAVQKYCQADKIMGVPTTAHECAKAFAAVGKLLEAKEAYLRAALYQWDPKNGPEEPEVFKSASADAKREADALGARIPELDIRIEGVEPGITPTIKVDGEPLRADIPRRPVNPARDYLVSATAPGYAPTSATVRAAEGDHKVVALALHKLAATPAPIAPIAPTAAPPPAKLPARPDKPVHEGGANIAAALGFGIGAVGLLAGAITGGVSLVQTKQLKNDCAGAGASLATCPATLPDGSSSQSRADAATALANASNGLLAVGGAGVVFGVIALFAFKPSEPKNERAALAVTPLVGPTSVGLLGRF